MPLAKLHKTIGVRVGSVQVGGGAPVVVQSMTMTDTADAASTARQCIELAEAGSELVRVTEARAGGTQCWVHWLTDAPNAMPTVVGPSLETDSLLYLAIVPLLPWYADEFGLGRVGAALLLAGYPVSFLLVTAPAGWLASRLGARRNARSACP